MNRFFKLIPLAWALAGAAVAQENSPKITFTSVAVPINRALSEVSKQASVRLEAVPAIANEIVILRVKDISLDDFMKRVATATAGQWEPMEGGYRLLPNSAARRLEEQAEKNAYFAEVSKAIANLVKSLNPPKPDPKAKKTDEEQMEEMAFFGGNSNPAGKAVTKLLQAIGPANIANIGEKERVVYSTNPTRMQRPLPQTANQILAQLVVDHNAYAKELQKNKNEGEGMSAEENEQMKKLKEFFGDFTDQDKPIEGTPTKAILVFSRQAFFGGLTATLKVYNEKGQVVITGSQMIPVGNTMYAEAMVVAQQVRGEKDAKKEPQAPAGEKPIELSAATKDILAVSNPMTMMNGPKMSDEVRAKLLNPEQYDPLSFLHSEVLIGTAEQRNKQLVAVLPDDVESLFGMMGDQSQKLLPTAYLNSMKDKFSVTEDGNWMVVRPVKPARARRERFDRVALGQFIRAVDAKGACGLDDLAAYALKAESPTEDQATMRYIMLFAPTAMAGGMGQMLNWDALRFYGGLSVNAKKSLIENGRLPFAQLTPGQAAAVRQMAFGPEESLTVDDPNGKKDELGALGATMRQMFMRAAGGDYRTEPTEVMPNGLPSDGYVQLTFTNDNVVKASGAVAAMLGNASLGVDELAMLGLFKTMEGMEQVASMMPTIDEVTLGKRQVYEFKFVVAPGVSMTQVLNNDSFDKGAPKTKMANLPDDFQKKIADRMAAFKKIPFFDPAFFGGGGRQAIPPAQ